MEGCNMKYYAKGESKSMRKYYEIIVKFLSEKREEKKNLKMSL